MQHADHAEQEEVLAPDEAPTPMWLPLLGAALLLLAVIFFAVHSRAGKSPTQAGEATPEAAAGAAVSAAAPSGEKP